MANGVKKINEWIMKDGRTINITTKIDAQNLEGGTLFINPSSGLLNYVNLDAASTKTWKKFDPVVIFEPQTIVTSLIKNKNVTTDKIADRNITTIKIAKENVTNEEIGLQQVYTKNIKDLHVTREKINDRAVNSIKIAQLGVTTENLAEPCVNGRKIHPYSITDGHVDDNTLTNRVLFDKTITHEKIANLTIISDLLAKDSVITDKIKRNAVVEEKIAPDSINVNHLQENSVSTAKIINGNVINEKIADLDGSKIWRESITDVKLHDNAVINRTIKNEAISYNKLDANLKDLTDRSIRVDASQTIGSETVANTAWVKGHLLVKMPTSGNANLKVHGDIVATGTVTATKCYNPVFADLAEAYIPTEEVKPGDAVSLSLKGGLKVEKLTFENQDRFIGFVSDEYATVFGATPDELRYGKKIAVTLVGRIKIKANGSANIGDYVYIANGEPTFSKTRTATSVGRVLENKTSNDNYVLCQLWP